MNTQGRHVFPENQHLPGIGFQQTQDQLQGHALALAAASGNDRGLVCGHIEAVLDLLSGPAKLSFNALLYTHFCIAVYRYAV